MVEKEDSNYSRSVPAVVRALAALEELSSSVEGLTLAELSRALRISPSSLSAILNTLTLRNYLLRDTATGRFILGPGLLSIATVSEPSTRLEAGFRLVAARLAEVTAETCLLWVLDGDETVIQAIQPGHAKLRLVCSVGTRTAARSTVMGQLLLQQTGRDAPKVSQTKNPAASEMPNVVLGIDPDDPSLSYVAAPVFGSGGHLVAVIGLGGPAMRLTASILVPNLTTAVHEAAEQLSMRLGWVHSHSPTPATRTAHDDLLTVAGGLALPELNQFLEGGHLVHIACIKPDGYPHTVPAWYEWDGTGFWITPRAHAAWAQYLRLNPRVSLAIDEPDPPLRRVLTEGRAELIEEPCLDGAWRAFMERMAGRYLGETASHYLERALTRPHWLFRVKPEQMRSWRGLTSHPKYESADESGVA